MAVLPEEIPTGLITGQFYFVNEDNIDAGTDPELTVVSGKVTFVCEATEPLRMPTKKAIIIPMEFDAEFDSQGRLVPAGRTDIGIELPASNSPLFNPTDFTWKVTFDLIDVATQYTIQIPSFSIVVPEGVVSDIVDLMPVSVAPGTIMVQGPQGDPGVMTSMNDADVAALIDNPASTTAGSLSATYDQSALSMHWARKAEIKRRKGGVIGTNGKSVIAFQIAHQLDPFKATIFEEFRKRGLPVGWGAVTGAVGDPADTYEPTTATWADVKKHFYEGAEVWAHSRTHLEPSPIGTDGGDTIKGEIQGAREDIEAQGLYAMGWQTAGVYPEALTPYYNDFMGPTTEDMSGWQSEVGQRLLANYGLISLISAGGKRFLPTDGSQGLGYWTFDNQTYTTTKAQIDILKDRPGHGLVLAMHPKNIGLTGMMSFADFTATLDYVKQLWDAGTVEIVTQSGMAFADPGTSRRLNLLIDNTFDGGTTTGSWGLVGGALRETSGGRTGSNFLRLPSGTGAYAAQGPGTNLRTWGSHGMVFMFDGWARNSDAVNTVGARVQIYANTPGGNVTLRDVTTTLAASAPWTRLRIPVGIPKDATNVVVQLMRSGLGTVDYDDVNLYAA